MKNLNNAYRLSFLLAALLLSACDTKTVTLEDIKGSSKLKNETLRMEKLDSLSTELSNQLNDSSKTLIKIKRESKKVGESYTVTDINYIFENISAQDDLLNMIKADIGSDIDSLDFVLFMDKQKNVFSHFDIIKLGIGKCVMDGKLSMIKNNNLDFLIGDSVAITPELKKCMKESMRSPTPTNYIYSLNDTLMLFEHKDHPDVRVIIDEAKKDKVINRAEFLKIVLALDKIKGQKLKSDLDDNVKKIISNW